VPRIAGESGQASVEAVATVPAVLVAALVGWQLVLAGHALWLCANAARAAARAEAVGESPARAARSVLPSGLERGLAVERRRAGAVRVEIGVPLLLAAGKSPVRVAATSSLGGRR
jgi:hypothetical protein